MLTAEGCKNLSKNQCPCFLALIDECTYCSLLQGKSVCNCDWDGDCAFNYYPWQEIHVPDCQDNTVLNTAYHKNAWKIVVKASEEVLQLPIGTQLLLENQETKYSPTGVILSTYPEHNLIVLVSFDEFPFNILRDKQVHLAPNGNVFLGSQFLQRSGQNITIMFDKAFSTILSSFVKYLSQNNHVMIDDLTNPLHLTNCDADVLVLIGEENKIKKVINNSPPSFKGQYIIWSTT